MPTTHTLAGLVGLMLVRVLVGIVVGVRVRVWVWMLVGGMVNGMKLPPDRWDSPTIVHVWRGSLPIEVWRIIRNLGYVP